MTDIRISGEPEEVNKIAAQIRELELTIISEKEYPARTEGEVLLYLRVQEPNQIIFGNLQDHQVIRYCRTWRSKTDVSNYFGVKWDAAGEILERLYESGDLARYLNDEGARKHHHYEYMDASLCHRCRDCSHSYIDSGETFCRKGVMYCRFIDPDELRSCPDFKP